MKGMILTELSEYAAERFPPAVDAATACTYEAQEIYSRAEVLDLVDRLSRSAGVLPPDLMRGFGVHLFARFAALYPVFFVEAQASIPFLMEINGTIHGEVQKLYPDARLPQFDCTRTADGGLEMIYRSQQDLPDLAEGAYSGQADHPFRSKPITDSGHADQVGAKRRWVGSTWRTSPERSRMSESSGSIRRRA